MLTATIGEVFPYVMRDPIEDTNTLIVASERAAVGRAPARGRARPARPASARTGLGAAGRLEEPLAGGDVYTDDKAPVEWLIDKSIVDYASGGDD